MILQVVLFVQPMALNKALKSNPSVLLSTYVDS